MTLRLPRRLRRRYKLALDDSGRPMRSSGGTRFALGGIVVANGDVNRVLATWRGWKTDLCGNPDVELKARHFFVPKLGEPDPLAGLNREARRTLAQRGVGLLFDTQPILPVISMVRKDRAGPEVFRLATKKGDPMIDVGQLLDGAATSFATFLGAKRGRGRIVCDQLGSGGKREQDWQSQWDTFVARTTFGRDSFQRVAGIEFVDSKANGLVQLADFVVGVLRYASEDGEPLDPSIGDGIERARAVGLGLWFIE